MQIQQVLPTVRPPTNLIMARAPMERYEKNWSPLCPADKFHPDDSFLFSTTVNPHNVCGSLVQTLRLKHVCKHLSSDIVVSRMCVRIQHAHCRLPPALR